MGKQFEIVREIEIQATPEQVWEALTNGTAGWLWPMEYEPREGGAAPFGGTVTAWRPPHRLTSRVDGEGGWFNQLDNTLEPREGGRTWLRYVHSGMFEEDWDNQYDGANKHTDFYLHTLSQYVQHFAGRQATYATFDEGPEASKRSDGFEVVQRALGLPESATEGDTVQVAIPGIGDLDATVDYRNPYFLGLRTDDAMYRFFGRNAFGDPVGISVHHFADADPAKIERALQDWMNDVFA